MSVVLYFLTRKSMMNKRSKPSKPLWTDSGRVTPPERSLGWVLQEVFQKGVVFSWEGTAPCTFLPLKTFRWDTMYRRAQCDG